MHSNSLLSTSSSSLEPGLPFDSSPFVKAACPPYPPLCPSQTLNPKRGRIARVARDPKHPQVPSPKFKAFPKGAPKSLQPRDLDPPQETCNSETTNLQAPKI